MRYAPLLLIIGLSGISYSQTVLFEDDFESGTSYWILNSNDLNSDTLRNKFVVNNVYSGGSYNYYCGGTTSTTSPTTPFQPNGISSPNGNYLHSASLVGFNGTIKNAHFIANNTFCQVDESNFVRMANPISTIGYDDVTVSFWTLLGATDPTYYGSIYYSLDGGTNWSVALSNIRSISTWKDTAVMNPQWNNASSLLFGIRFTNLAGFFGYGPGFSIDDFKVTGTQSGPTVTTQSLTTSSFCSGNTQNITIPFAVSGTVNAGNVYTAYLSDAAGSFASPTVLGTLTSSSSGNLTISGTVPISIPVGTAYRIRVDASNPAVVGVDNGSDLSFVALPSISVTSQPTDGIICAGGNAILTASGATAYSWTPSNSLNSAVLAEVFATPTATTEYTVTGTDVNGCSNIATFTVTVENCAGIDEQALQMVSVYPNPATETISFDLSAVSGVKALSLVDISGRIVATIPATATSWSVADLESGKYFFVVEHAAGTAVKAFVKK